MAAGSLTRGRARRPRRSDGELALGALWTLWCWRLEFGLLLVFTLAERGLARLVGHPVGVVSVALVAAVALLVARSRRTLLRSLYVARVRRAVGRAAFDAALAEHPWSVPRVLAASRVAAGDRVQVRVGRGRSLAEVEARSEELAGCLRAREVRVLRDPANAAEGTLVVVRTDPFEGGAPLPWPAAAEEDLSVWDSVALGVDEQGEVLSLRLPERNVLLGGEPGAGKSAALSLLVAAAALDPTARLWLLDGKLVELAAWAPVAQRVVGTSGPEAIELLREVQAEIDARYRELLARALRKVGRDDGMPLHLVVCDELAFYLSLPDRHQRQTFTELLRDLVARGRAAGVIVCAATQKPGSDVVPTSLRDLFGFRVALRCNTPQASDTVLGQGWASAGADASTVPGGQRGVGYLLTEGERPVRFKGFYLGDEDVRAIAERAAARRADAWLADTTAGTADDEALRSQ